MDYRTGVRSPLTQVVGPTGCWRGPLSVLFGLALILALRGRGPFASAPSPDPNGCLPLRPLLFFPSFCPRRLLPQAPPPPYPHDAPLQPCPDLAVSETFSMVFCFLVLGAVVSFALVPPSSEKRRGAKKAPPRGLDPAVLASFPVSPYADLAGTGMVGEDCTVCLTEFGGDGERATCPLCRADLAAGAGGTSSDVVVVVVVEEEE